jgi:hypothetical protein
MRKRWTAALLLGLMLAAQPAYAWDAVGHQAIAQIAWESMTPRARQAAVALLNQAPDDSDLLRLYPLEGNVANAERTLFDAAASWADVVRDRSEKARYEKYFHGPWHYIDYYFRETPRGTIDLLHPAPDSVNAVTELERMSAELDRASIPAPERAIDLAWIIHLVGDIHQPLHAESRVTAEEPKGDAGGNFFKLADDHNLHSYWDSAITREFPEQPGESRADRLARIAEALMALHPRSEFRDRLQPGQFNAWAIESYRIAKTIYDTPQGQEPGEAYRERTFEIANRRAALAGYRLAALLNRELGGAK